MSANSWLEWENSLAGILSLHRRRRRRPGKTRTRGRLLKTRYCRAGEIDRLVDKVSNSHISSLFLLGLFYWRNRPCFDTSLPSTPASTLSSLPHQSFLFVLSYLSLSFPPFSGKKEEKSRIKILQYIVNKPDFNTFFSQTELDPSLQGRTRQSTSISTRAFLLRSLHHIRRISRLNQYQHIGRALKVLLIPTTFSLHMLLRPKQQHRSLQLCHRVID